MRRMNLSCTIRDRFGEARQERWRTHQHLQRGNPTRVIAPNG
jgi:hypothetical protein